MDSFVTILIYVGAFVLISVAKSISGSAKKKERQNVPQTIYSEDDYHSEQDFSYKKEADDYAQYLQKIDTSMPHIEADYLFEEGERVFRSEVEEKNYYSEDEAEFILDDFDLKSAIIYSAILNRPDY